MKFLAEYQSVVGDPRWGPTSVLIYNRDSRTLALRRVERGCEQCPNDHTLGVFGPNAEGVGRGSQGSSLCSSNCHRSANLLSYRFIVAGLFDLQLIPPKAPSGPLPPLSGRGLLFLRCVSAAVLVGDEADHVFLIVDMSAVHSPGMGRARGLRRFPKREVRA
jgi:hypothetical protein